MSDPNNCVAGIGLEHTLGRLVGYLLRGRTDRKLKFHLPGEVRSSWGTIATGRYRPETSAVIRNSPLVVATVRGFSRVAYHLSKEGLSR